MKYLIVVAHPDDEVLGAGASIFKWTHDGAVVDVCIMSSNAKARAFRPEDNELNDDINSSSDYLGIGEIFEFAFPNTEMNTVPHLHLVQTIEKAIAQSKPDIVITHHPADTNNDHLQTSLACQEAIRLHQRRPELKHINDVWYMEVPSSTEWAINSAFQRFTPNCYVEVGEEFVEAKIKALSMYHGVMRPYPHPRTRALPAITPISSIDSGFKEKLLPIADYVGFPAIIKPNLSQSAKGIVRVDNLEELVEKYPEIYRQFGACTLQEYVNPPGYYYNVMLYRDRKGNTDNYTIIKIQRFFPLKGGSSCYCETVEHDYLLTQCRNVLEKLDWIGFADFDVLEDKNTGELKIIEINPRVPSSFQTAFAAGVDFGKVFIADELNAKVPTFEYKTGKQVRWMGLDMMWFVFSSDRFKFKPSWFNFFGKDVSYHDGALNDPLPMLTGMVAGIIKYLNPEFRKAKLRD